MTKNVLLLSANQRRQTLKLKEIESQTIDEIAMELLSSWNVEVSETTDNQDLKRALQNRLQKLTNRTNACIAEIITNRVK